MSKIFITPEDTALHESGGMSVNSIGGKAHSLVAMSALGIDVPPFVIIPIEQWKMYKEFPSTALIGVTNSVDKIFSYFQKKMGYLPLLSVRSGAPVSCPGMMDTILNVGIDENTYESWCMMLGDDCALDCYTKFMYQYGKTVLEIPDEDFGDRSQTECEGAWVKYHHQYPQKEIQVARAVEAVWKSWDSPRAIAYRKENGIDHDLGTAVTIQAMVFGNTGETSCTGVLFSRDPNTGEHVIKGEFLPNAQGEDIVSGVKTPQNIDYMSVWNPVVYSVLLDWVEKLEGYYRDMVDVEFTVQYPKLWMLQARPGKRTPQAAVRIAKDLIDGKVRQEHEFNQLVTARQVMALSKPQITIQGAVKPIATGIAASSGIGSGFPAFTVKDAINMAKAAVPFIFFAKETSPHDYEAMLGSTAVVTQTGGFTSHAAVVARGMNRPAVVGVDTLDMVNRMLNGDPIDPTKKYVVNGTTGRVYKDVSVLIQPGGQTSEYKTVASWVKKWSNHIPILDKNDWERTRGCMGFSDIVLMPVVEQTKFLVGFEGLVTLFDPHHMGESLTPDVDFIMHPAESSYERIEWLKAHISPGKSKFKVYARSPEDAEHLEKSGFIVVREIDLSADFFSLLDAKIAVGVSSIEPHLIGPVQKVLELRRKANDKLILISFGQKKIEGAIPVMAWETMVYSLFP